MIHIISYRPLWETMKRKGISQYYLLQNGLDNRVLDSLKHDRNITVLTLEKVCNILECNPNEVIEFIKE